MMEFVLRDASEEDCVAILALNDAEVQHTSPMDMKQLQPLAGIASYYRVVAGEVRVTAFLLALREGAPYLNANFAWFAARYARSRNVGVVTCEYNVEPPNPSSQRFHDMFGFNEVGRRWAVPGTKLVSMQAAEA